MHKLLVFIALILITNSCQQSSELEKKHEEIMKIHDEVMPLMGNIYQLKKNLQASQIVQDSIVLKRISQLNLAEETMMDWMANYQKPKTWGDKEQAYLANQLEDVTNLSEIMKTAISESEELYKMIKQ